MKTVSLCTLLGLFAILGATLYSCQDARNQYYAALNRCTSQRGSWVPTNADGSGYSGLCLYPH